MNRRSMLRMLAAVPFSLGLSRLFPFGAEETTALADTDFIGIMHPHAVEDVKRLYPDLYFRQLADHQTISSDSTIVWNTEQAMQDLSHKLAERMDKAIRQKDKL